MYQNIFQRHLRRGEQRTFSNLEAKEYLIHSGTFDPVQPRAPVDFKIIINSTRACTKFSLFILK